MNSVKCKTENMAVRDYCLVWGCLGLVILTISLFVSLKVGNDFGQDNFAKLVTFVISSGLLGTVYYLFQSVLTEVPLRLHNEQCEGTIPLTDQEAEAVTEDLTDSDILEQVQECLAEMPPQSETAQGLLLEELQEPTIEISDSAEPTKEVTDTTETSTEQPDLYAQRCKEYQREQEQRRQDTIDAIMEYVTHTMSPYIYDNEELEKLRDAIRKWADDWRHFTEEFVDELDQVTKTPNGKHKNLVPTNIWNSQYFAALHYDAKSGIPHLHLVVNRIDKDGNINDCHFIGERAVAAAQTINLRHGWKDPMEIREEHLQQITGDCMDVLKSLPHFDRTDYEALLTRRGYKVKLQRDKENVVRGYSIKKGNSSYKSSELGIGRNLTPTKIEYTWRKLHPAQKPMAGQAPKPLDSKKPIIDRPSTAQASSSQAQWLGQEKQTLDDHHRQQEESWQKHSQRLTAIVKNNEGVWISTKLFYVVGSLSLLSIITIAIEIAFYVYFKWIA